MNGSALLLAVLVALVAAAGAAMPAMAADADADAAQRVSPRTPFGGGAPVPRSCKYANSRITSRTTRRARSAIHCLINDVRRRARRPGLRTSSKLQKAAVAHTRDMVRRRYFAHVGPGGPTIAQRLRKVRYRTRHVDENLAYLGDPTPVRVVNQWLASRVHSGYITGRRPRYLGMGIVARAPLAGFPRNTPAATITVKFGRYR